MLIQILQEMQNGMSSRLFGTKSILLFMQDRVILAVITQLWKSVYVTFPNTLVKTGKTEIGL